MQAQVLVSHSVETIQMETIELGDPGPGEVLVRHHVTAMSPGTERASLLALPNTGTVWPFNVGYSAVGEVVAAGPGVELAPGTRVLTKGRHGTADLAPMRDVFLVDDDVADQDAAFHTLLRISMQAVRKARVELGETVLVLGGGLIGQLGRAVRLCGGRGGACWWPTWIRHDEPWRKPCRGSSPWTRPQRRSVPPLPMATRVDRRWLSSPPVSRRRSTTAFIMAGHLARVVLLGSTRGSTESVNFYRDVHKKGLTIIGAHDSIRQPDAGDNPVLNALPVLWSPRRDVAVAMRMAAVGRITLDPLITHRVKGSEFKTVYDLLLDFEPSLVGCLFDWR